MPLRPGYKTRLWGQNCTQYFKIKVTDEELMEHIDIAESEETERKNKFGATNQKSVPKVNQVEAENVRELVSPFRKPVTKRNRNTTTYKPITGFHRRWVCGACQEENKDFSDHCFICGSNRHFARGCRSYLKPGKLEKATTVGQGVADQVLKPHIQSWMELPHIVYGHNRTTKEWLDISFFWCLFVR